MSISFSVFNEIESVPKSDWAKFSNTQTLSFNPGYIRAVEKSGINKAKLYYLVGYSAGNPVGIAHLFVMDIDYSGMNNSIDKTIMTALKAWSPDLMQTRILECGFLATIGQGFVVSGDCESLFIDSLQCKVEEIAQQEKAKMILFRDISIADYPDVKHLETHGFLPLLGYPQAKMRIEWNSFDEYLGSLTSKRRKDIRRSMLRAAKPDLQFEWTTDVSAVADELIELWNAVELKSEYKHELLNKEYFQELSRNGQEWCKFLLLKVGGRIIAFSLYLESDMEILCSYVGIDYSKNSEYGSYFNMLYKSIELAIECKKTFLNLGITTYDPKLLVGCDLHHLVYFIKYRESPDSTLAMRNYLEKSIELPEKNYSTFRDRSRMATPTHVAARDLISPKHNSAIDIFSRLYDYDRTEFAKLLGVYAFFPAFESAQDAVMLYKGREIIMFGSNSYLALGSDPEVKAAASEAISRYGTGCSGSPLLNGTLDMHEDLALQLADFTNKEEALIYSTGYQTNVGVVSTLAGPGDVIIMDERCHASLIDGALLSRARIIRFRHNNMESLEKKLVQNRGKPILVIADSLYSMEGTVANLPEIVRLAKNNNARIMLDESHAIGVLGPKGAGVADLYGLSGEVDIIMGTFSKSLAAQGGFISGEKKIIHAIKHLSRSHIFSASLAPSMVGAARKALDIVRTKPELRKNLVKNASFLADGLMNLGFEVEKTGGAILPLYCRDEYITLALFHKLFEKGVFVNPVVYPAVPKGSELLRISIMATTTETIIDRALGIFEEVRTHAFPIFQQEGCRD